MRVKEAMLGSSLTWYIYASVIDEKEDCPTWQPTLTRISEFSKRKQYYPLPLSMENLIAIRR